MSDAGAVLPEKAVLVHIGPYKTGTTAIQFALHLHRDDLLEYGVLYPAGHHRQARPVYALMQKTPSGMVPAAADEWDDLVRQVRSTAMRVCISTEDLASAGVETIRKLVDDLGPERVHVLIVVRRLDKILPSAWQERVKSWNETLSYDEWLREVLADDPATTGAGRRFWRNHGVMQLLTRWTEALTAERCILLVADERDRTQQMRTFERLLGLPQLLTEGGQDNTSLSLDRVELLRRVNERFARRGWSAEHRRKLVYRGLLKGLRQAPPHSSDVPIPPLPRWAAERIAVLSDARMAEVLDSGARIIGDPESLRYAPDTHPDQIELQQSIPIETAAKGVEYLLQAALKMDAGTRRAGEREQRAPARPPSSSGETALSERLFRTMTGRVREQLMRRRAGAAG